MNDSIPYLNTTAIKLNIQTFLFKSRCKHCASLPTTMFFYLDKHADLYNYRHYRHNVGPNYKGAQHRLSYMFRAPHSFAMNEIFDEISLNVRKARLPGIKYQQGMELVSILECQCGKTSWAFIQSYRDHIKRRKCEIKVSRNIRLY